jgi:hypothetical protein
MKGGLPFKKKDLDKLQNLSYSEGKAIIDKMPTAMLTKLFSSVCDRNQIKQLFTEYYHFYNHPETGEGEPEKVKKKYRKKLKAMLKNMKKSRRWYEVPRNIREHKF